METTGMQVNLLKLFEAGGFFMWPLLFLSIFAVALILERIIAIRLFHVRTEAFLAFLGSRGKNGDPSFYGIDAGLFTLSREEADRTIGEAVQLSFDRMGRNLELLSAAGNIAPLVGFIGTVSGMIASFQSIADADKVSVRLVAGGISEALITTGAGLIIAVICIFTEHLARYYLAARAHRIEEETSLLLSGKKGSPSPDTPLPAGG